ncbi:gamma-glutamyl-gamma-aminobutyrate hydrolase family protein [bacterium]|nr:gamma-glutamyl-gamma-aminobutyrate hydrolase family protein [bacterium]
MPATAPPLIGITSSLKQNKAGTSVCTVGQAYVTAITNAGGIPLIIPIRTEMDHLPNLVARLDGLLLSGGGDIHPRFFQGDNHPKIYGVSEERDQLEFNLVRLILEAHKPLLAICRGIQVLNVTFGGSLLTHIEDQFPNPLKHDWFPDYPRDKIAHSVSLACGRLLHDICRADDIQVNSLHHQGIDQVGDGLEAIAFAPDGLVEGVVVKGERFALGMQWHPECLSDNPQMQALFSAFVNACQEMGPANRS